MSETILEIQNLRTHFYSNDTEVRACDNLSFTVNKGECVAIIGESGSGKSVSALSVLRLIPFPPGIIVKGKILFHGQNLLDFSDEEMEDLRGSKISMIFQEPSTALDPVMTVGNQICEALMSHNKGMKKKEAMKRAIELLEQVEIPNPQQRARQYPHEFSGGMQQRVMIAMAMSCNPELLIADEPTTALDVTVQAQVLEQLNQLRTKLDMTLIIITHNLGVVARYADNVKIMYGGKIVEEGNPDEIFEDPHHPYTVGLIRAVPRLDLPRSHGLHTIDGEPPDMSQIPPKSCAFAGRCQYTTEECRTARPKLETLSDSHRCACFHMDQVLARREVL